MKPLILHCHMPKTAGSALNRQVFMPRHDPSRIKLAYGVKFERRRRFPTDEMALPNDVEFIAGHVPVGYADDLGRHVLHVSILRDPVERMFSFLNFVAVAPRHGLRRRFDVDIVALAQTDPAEYVSLMLADDMVRLRQTNVMTRLASGMARLSKNSPAEPQLRRALKYIRSGWYEIGTQENFDHFAKRLKDRLNTLDSGCVQAGPLIAGSGVAEKRLPRIISKADATPRMIDMVRDANTLDQRLYDFVSDQNARTAH
ncbi:MAG: hypothetical protein ACPGVA_14855 [Pikeienuella sp.]